MTVQTEPAAQPVWIRGPRLRQRWDNMSNSGFYAKLKMGLLPKPEYPFGPNVPYWRMDVIEQFERSRGR